MKHKILIVDDDDAIREELLEHLGHKGYTCHEASGVGPALESLHKNPDIAIILTDIRMPGRDGTELISTARDECERDLEFIIMEIFPPVGSALLTLETSDECWTIEAQLEAKSYVSDVTCEPWQPNGEVEPGDFAEQTN